MVYHKADGNWYETQDLTVTEVLPQQIGLGGQYSSHIHGGDVLPFTYLSLCLSQLVLEA